MNSTVTGPALAAAAAGQQQAGEPFVFWLLAIVSVAAALGMIFMRKAVHSALLLAVVMLSLAVLYAVLDAPFLAFVQVIVYTGAVLMLFLFVLMLVGVTSTDSLVETIKGQRVLAAIAGIGFVVLLLAGIGGVVFPDTKGLASANSKGNVIGLATLLFTKYVFAFEVTSALLITAALGAMVLAHRERITPKPTQRELSKQRFLGDHPTPLPGPGTYARHNAVDMPALLPDGSVAELSINPVLARRAATAQLHVDLRGESEQDAVQADLAAVRAVTVASGTTAGVAGGAGAMEAAELIGDIVAEADQTGVGAQELAEKDPGAGRNADAIDKAAAESKAAEATETAEATGAGEAAGAGTAEGASEEGK